MESKVRLANICTETIGLKRGAAGLSEALGAFVGVLHPFGQTVVEASMVLRRSFSVQGNARANIWNFFGVLLGSFIFLSCFFAFSFR